MNRLYRILIGQPETPFERHAALGFVAVWVAMDVSQWCDWLARLIGLW
jgi:hypothetical protein